MPSYFVGIESDPKSVLRSDKDLSMSDQYLVGMMYLAPSKMSGYNTCAHATKGCSHACLAYAGMGAMIEPGKDMSRCNEARVARTRIFFQDRPEAFRRIKADLNALVRRSVRRGLKPACRLNGMSDLPWERIMDPETGKTLFELYPQIQFYDYTASYDRMLAFCDGKMPENYWLTFSRKETILNHIHCLGVLARGGNIAVPFATEEEYPLSFYDRPIINGTESDLRFHDGKGKIIALCAKGKKAKADDSGFIVRKRDARIAWDAPSWS